MTSSLTLLSSLNEYNATTLDIIVEHISTAINYKIILTESNHKSLKCVNWSTDTETRLLFILNEFDFYISLAYLKVVDREHYYKFLEIAIDTENGSEMYQSIMQQHYITNSIPDWRMIGNTRTEIIMHLRIVENLDSERPIIELCIDAIRQYYFGEYESLIDPSSYATEIDRDREMMSNINYDWRFIIADHLSYAGIHRISLYLDKLNMKPYAGKIFYKTLDTLFLNKVVGPSEFDYNDSYKTNILKQFYEMYIKYVDCNFSEHPVYSYIAFLAATWKGRNVWSELKHILTGDIDVAKEFINILKVLQQDEIDDIYTSLDNSQRVELQASLTRPELVEIYDNFVETVGHLKNNVVLETV